MYALTYIVDCTHFVVDMAWHVSPYFQAVLWLIPVLRDRGRFERIRVASLLASTITRQFAVQMVLLVPLHSCEDATRNIPGRIRRGILLHSFDAELTKVCHLPRLTMIARPFARALVMPLAWGRRRDFNVMRTRCFRR